MKKLLIIAPIFFAINLVPYVCWLLLLGLEEGTIIFSLVQMCKALFEMPTSLIWFIVQSDLGEAGWIIFNVLGLGGSIFITSQL